MRIKRLKFRVKPLIDNGQKKQNVNKLKKPKNNILRQILENEDLSYKLLIIAITLLNGPVKLDRKMDTMTATVNRLRGMTEVLNTTMNALKTASEAPRQIRQLLE